jgi:Alpha-L-arabinofuranosidase C-terminal domain
VSTQELGRRGGGPGAKSKVVFFEDNSGNHAMKRALSNARATNEAVRIGGLLPIACAANCLQPDGQNDNGWDQGLLFLNPSKVWLQPPGYLTRMTRRDAQPLLVASEVRGPAGKLSANAKRGDDGKTLIVQVVNWGDDPRAVRIEVAGFSPSSPSAKVEQLAGPLDASNTADQPERIKPDQSEWRHGMENGRASYTFPPRSFTVLRLE